MLYIIRIVFHRLAVKLHAVKGNRSGPVKADLTGRKCIFVIAEIKYVILLSGAITVIVRAEFIA